jgi:hypothetical protein
MYNGALYEVTANITAAANTAWSDVTATLQPTRIVFDLTQELGSNGVTVEVVLKKKTAGTISLDVTDVNGTDPNKTFTKRFENALVWVADQKDNK